MKFPDLNIEEKIGRKSKMIWAAAGVLVIGTGVILASATNSREKTKKIGAEKPETTLYRDNKVTGLEQTAADIQLMKRRFEEVLDRSSGQEATLKQLNQKLSDLTGKLSELESRPPEMGAPNEQLRPGGDPNAAPTFRVGQAAPPSAQLNTPLPLPKPLQAAPSPGAPIVPPVMPGAAVPPGQGAPAAASASARESAPERGQPDIRLADSAGNTFDFQAHKQKSKEEYEQAFSDKKEPTVFMPAGSMFSAVLLTGVDMPTSTATQQSPVPVVFRIKREAILPNFASIDVRECFLLGSGYGQMSSERAILRAEALTCVTSKGKVLETQFNAFIVGTDGKVGLPGRLVSKQGAMIARSLLGGVFAGLSGQSSPSLVPNLNLNPGGGQLWQDPEMGAIARSGAATGVSTAANSISRFYLKMAEETFPVVEISAGQGVTVVVSGGSTLPLKGSTQLENVAAAKTPGAAPTAAAAGVPPGLAGTTQQPRGVSPAAALQPSQSNPQAQAGAGGQQQQPQQQPTWASGQSFGRPAPQTNPLGNIENFVRDAVSRTGSQQPGR